MKPYYWLNNDSKLFLKRGYLADDQSPEDRIKQIAKAAEKILTNGRTCNKGFAKKFEEYMSYGWYSLSSPIWANFGLNRGLPISCFGSYIDDTMEAILGKTAEVGMMTKMGGGTSAYFGDLRSRGSNITTGGESSGPVHFMELFETTTNVVSQSNVRRGSFAAYLPIDHPDALEFLQIRGDGNTIQNISIGLTIKDEWMRSMIDGDKEKRKIWGKVIQKRFESGFPYIFFEDTVNKNAPKVYKKKKKKIHASNLCSEIMLSTDNDESFVCNLSSMNLLHYDEWKDTDAVETLITFLDAVMTEFINKTEDIPYMQAPRNFAINQRALGLGVLGWHSYLQKNDIAFESLTAKGLTNEIFSLIKTKCDEATKTLAEQYGEPPLLEGEGVRNVTTMAIAPTTSSSFILGQVSPSIEPLNSNYFVKDLAKGKFTYKNPYLRKVLTSHKQNTKEVWQSILVKGGSVQHLDFLSDHEKEVFKTFGEISQKDIIIQASIRQKWIDQGQSLNVMISPDIPPKQVNQLMIYAWEEGIKTLYYHRGTNPSQELSRNILTCSSCEG
jgi:ribonucleoside-diphosphate reductase alpha chain